MTTIKCTKLLATALSSSLLEVSQKCLEASLISTTQMKAFQVQEKDDYNKASELVTAVTEHVETCPIRYRDFCPAQSARPG